MIEKMLAAHVTMTGLYGMLDDLVKDAERIYCASGNPDDKRRWDKLMQSRAAHVESMCHFAEAGGAEVTPAAEKSTGETLNANRAAL